ncbi:hypothetical protein F4779DRAFT_589193 [Xylariaceae sp. FL0662B]|nr:hypothetical protein F4779DRAFT_589193 [Xylariaceae sp. FL0662B]
MHNFTLGKMYGSIDLDDYELPSLDRSGSSAAPSNDDFDFAFPFEPSFSETIEPSSLNLFHTSHDDTCISNVKSDDDTYVSNIKCRAPADTQGLLRGPHVPPVTSRLRLNGPSLPYYPGPDHGLFQPIPQQFNQPVPGFFPDASFKYGQNHHPKSSYPLSHNDMRIGNHFNAADLGLNLNSPAADDCVSVNCSKYACSSDCCSTQVCQEEACSGEGTPCDDMHCFDQPLDHIWNLQQAWDTSTMQPEVNAAFHNQPCNHTNTEHDVAITLRMLSAPGACNMQQQQSLAQPDCPVFHANGYPTAPTQTLSKTPKNESDGMAKYTCQWIVPGDSESQETVCGCVFDDNSSLQDHLIDDHLSVLSSKTRYLCLWKGCSRRDDQVFASRNKLKRHIGTHTSYKPYKCDICGEGYSAQQALDQHVRTHTGETPYTCDVEGCNKSFKQKSALTMHKRTHTGEKPLQCELCGKRFCESSNLSKHRKTHNPNFKFKCEEPGCDSQFIRIDQLRRHQMRHDKQRKRKRPRTQTTPISSTSPDTPAE